METKNKTDEMNDDENGMNFKFFFSKLKRCLSYAILFFVLWTSCISEVNASPDLCMGPVRYDNGLYASPAKDWCVEGGVGGCGNNITLLNEPQIDDVIDMAVEHKIKYVFFKVGDFNKTDGTLNTWYRRDNSTDPLYPRISYTVQKAHEKNLKIIAWITGDNADIRPDISIATVRDNIVNVCKNLATAYNFDGCQPNVEYDTWGDWNANKNYFLNITGIIDQEMSANKILSIAGYPLKKECGPIALSSECIRPGDWSWSDEFYGELAQHGMDQIFVMTYGADMNTMNGQTELITKAVSGTNCDIQMGLGTYDSSSNEYISSKSYIEQGLQGIKYATRNADNGRLQGAGLYCEWTTDKNRGVIVNTEEWQTYDTEWLGKDDLLIVTGTCAQPYPLSPVDIARLIFAKVHNYGNDDANDVVVKFYDKFGGTENLLHSETINLTAGNSRHITIERKNLAAGEHEFTVKLDPDGLIPESDENNNVKSVIRTLWDFVDIVNDPSKLGGVNFTDIKLTSISMCPADGLSTFKFVFKANEANETEQKINATKAADDAFEAFLVGLTIPNQNFWVNLHPDKPDVLVGNMTNETYVGEVMMAADLLLKKIKANEKNPCNSSNGLTLQNRNNALWGEILNNASTNESCIGQINEGNKPKITHVLAVRNEIVPGSVTVEGDDCRMFIVNASLSIEMEGIENLSYVKVENGTLLNTTCLEYLNTSVKQNLLPYLVEQEKELILPAINYTVNYGDDYKELRQVYTSLALAQWYKAKWKENNRPNQTIYSPIIDKGNLTGLNSTWNATEYWDAFKKSWDEGEYHCTINGTTYTSGGVNFRSIPVTFYNLTSETETLVEDAVNTPYVNQSREYYFGGDFYVPYPDISPVYISFDSPDILLGTQVNITAVVKNRGFVGAENFTVKFYRDEFIDENGSHYYAIAEKNISLLAGESGEVLISYTFDTLGNHTVYVSIDYRNNVVESDENNNIIMRDIYVTAPDLVPVNISFNPASNATTGTAVNITATIENRGGADARNFTVKFYRDRFTDENGSHYFIIAEKSISLNVNESLNVSAVYTFLTAGNHTVYVEIDPGNDILEWNESNNILMDEIYVLAPDLIPISLIPEFDRMIVGMKTKLTARILNNGTVSAENFTVKFYYNKIETGEGGYTYYTIPNGEVNISLNPNESVEVSVDWTPPVSGDHTVYVFADFNKKFYEENETNNEIMANVNVQPILTASPDSVEIKSKLQYSINLVNQVNYMVENVAVVSHLPVGFRYVNETAELEGESVNVSITGNGSVGQNLTFNLLNINLAQNTFKTLVFEVEVGCDAVAGTNINYVNISEYYHDDGGTYWYRPINVDVGVNTYTNAITGVSLRASNNNPTYFEYVDYTAYVPNPTAQDAYIDNYTFTLPPYLKYAPGYSTIDGNEIWEPVVCGDYKDRTTGQVINFQNDSHGLNCSNIGIFNEFDDNIGHTLVYKSITGSKLWAHNHTGSKIKFRIQVIPGVSNPSTTYVNVFYTNPFCLMCGGAGGQSTDIMSNYGFSREIDSFAIFVNETNITRNTEPVNQTPQNTDCGIVGTRSVSAPSCGLNTNPSIPFEYNNLMVSQEVSSFKANPGEVITQTVWVTDVEYSNVYNLTLIPVLPGDWAYTENITCVNPLELGDTCKFIYEITVPDNAIGGLYGSLIKASAVDGGGGLVFYKEIKTYFSVEETEEPWYNTSWNYRKPVTLNSNETLTDYQISVKLNSSNFDFSKANPDGSDVRFVDGNKELNYWIESWNSTAGEAKVWVKVNLTGSKNVYTYYGNPKVYIKEESPVVYENWESGTVGSKWSTGGNQPFIISGTAYEGGYSAGNGDVGDSQSSYIQTTVTLSKQAELSFYWKVSSEGGWDYLRFYVDGVQQNAISGEVNWDKQTYSLSDGAHTLTWYYTKDGSVSSRSDTGWVDKIELKNVTQKNVTDTGDKVFKFFDGAETGWSKWTSHDGWILSTGGYAHSGTYGFNSYPAGSQTERNMYSSAINLTDFSGKVNLTFWYRNQKWCDGCPYFTHYVYASSDGVNWNQLRYYGSTHTSWTYDNIDVSGYSGGMLYLRFRYYSYYAPWYDGYGLNVDDVRIIKQASLEPSVSFGEEEFYWWNKSWSYRKTITLNSGENLTDYQILITLNSSNFDFSKAKINGSDLRFIDKKKELDYWVEEWGYNNAKVWVKVNLTGTKEIYVYYGNPNITLEEKAPVVYENWESGTMGGKWSTGGNQPFIISNTAYEGSYSAGNGDIGDSQSSYIQTTINLTQQTELSFYWKVSSEGGWDYLRFYVDGAQQNAMSGYVEWNKQTYILSNGFHTLTWYYTKDSSVSSGSDTGWIDKIELKNVTLSPGERVFEFFDDFSNGLGKWSGFGSPPSQTYTESQAHDGYCYTPYGDGWYPSGSYSSLINISKGIVLNARLKEYGPISPAMDEHIVVGIGLQQTGYTESNVPMYSYVNLGGNTGYMTLDYYASGITTVTESNDAQWHYYEIKHNSTNYIQMFKDGVLKNSGQLTSRPYDTLPILLWGRDHGRGSPANDAKLDYVFARKYASQEPSVSVGLEQVSQSSLDLTYNSVNLEITGVEVSENTETGNNGSAGKKQKISDNLREKLNDAENNSDNGKKKQKNEVMQNISVIIKFKENVTDFSLMNGKLNHKFKKLNAASAKLSPQDIENLVNETSIESIELDVVVSSLIYESVPMLNIPQVHALGYNGSGVKVAVLDTGILHNKTLFNIGSEHDFIEDDNYSQDENGHGTHVSGIVAASAPGVEIMPIRVLDASGSGYASDVIAGIEWAVENGADVISLSLGAPGSDGSSAMSQAADNAAASGVVVVAAAGNNPSGITSPGDARDVITVGAIDKSKNVASFSGRGPTADGRAKPDLVAVGVSVYSYSLNGMEYKSGTSQAVPFVSGISALLIESNKTGYEIKNILKATAHDLGYEVNAQGAGMVDAYAAFRYNVSGVNGTNENTAPVIESIEVTPGETVNYNFTVENLGETSDTFTVYTEGIPAEWINISTSVTVNAREKVNEKARITIPENMTMTENTIFNFTIYVTGKSRDRETAVITVLATKQSVKNYVVNEIRDLETGIEHGIKASEKLNNPVNASTNTTLIDGKFGEDIIKKLDKAVDSIKKDDLVQAGKTLTGISSELSKEKGGKISNEFAEYLIAKVEEMRNRIK